MWNSRGDNMWPQFQFLLVPLPTFFSDDLAIPKCVTHVHTFVAVNMFPLCLEHVPSGLLSFPGLNLITLIFGICQDALVVLLGIH